MGLLHFEWVKNAWSRGAKPRGTRVWELCKDGEIWHEMAMRKRRRLQDAYRFPGF
jgi:hypothetical protein